MKCDFVVGDEVVFVGWPEGYGSYRNGEKLPKLNQKYTIRDVCALEDCVMIRLIEIVNPVLNYSVGGFGECGFVSTAFRKVRKTNIDVFKAILNKTPEQNKKELENA